MFTGIIQALCPVIKVSDSAGIRSLRVDLNELAQGLELGASVAINGVCLTVTEIDQNFVDFEIIEETLSLTNLGSLTCGSLVNTERSLSYGQEVGGHVVSGHITEAVEIIRIDEKPQNKLIALKVRKELAKYLFDKGFVAIDGASLTVFHVDREASIVEIALIPETIRRTTIGFRVVGEFVNLELDSQTVVTVDSVERISRSAQHIANT
tara:strand:- start:254 stop:880 length:627 start_codon:yes stop_codon:yes gene_type:complete